MIDIKHKKCNICAILKPHTFTYFPIEKNNKSGLSGTCLICRGELRKLRDENLKHTEKPCLKTLTCSVCKIDKPATTEYFHKHSRSTTGYKNSCKECRKLETHSYVVSENYKNKVKERRQKDQIWKLKKNISVSICNSLRKYGSTKEASCFKYLGYSIEQLKKHLEDNFEPWMNWDNWGQVSTNKQTWNIDHIYPQSKLPYDSMTHPNFIKCWGLENLRPLSAIENIKKSNNIKE